MTLLEQLLLKLKLRRESGMHSYRMDDRLHARIGKMAVTEKIPEEEITARLLESALMEHNPSQDLWSRWELLSRREQEVTALTCLGYTNFEIAARLGVSQPTITTHIRNIVKKFEMHGKAELRLALKDWDFTEWDRRPHK